MKIQKLEATIDDEGRLVLPAEIVKQYELRKGTKIHIDKKL